MVDQVSAPGSADAAPESDDVVERLFAGLEQLVQDLADNQQLTRAIDVSTVASKALLLAAASRFEAEMVEMLRETFRDMGSADLANFAVNQGLIRKYHTLFNWDAANVNTFLKLFGEDFKLRAGVAMKSDPDFSNAAAAFILIGRGRNELVHSDFAAFPLEDTLDELMSRYRTAKLFIPRIR